MGDAIQLFPLILSLKGHFRKTKFFLPRSSFKSFLGKLKEYKIELETLDLNLKYFGFRWWHILFTKKKNVKNRIGKFDLIIDLQTKFP